MKKIILSLLLTTSFTLLAEECFRPEESDEFESPIAYMDEEGSVYYSLEESEYEKQLNEYLENHQDINIQLIGFMQSYNFKDNPKKIKQIKQTLKVAINLGIDKYTIYLADNLCHTIGEITSWCHQKNIHEIHAQVDPENIMAYLSTIHIGDSKDDTQKILLTASENSTYSNIYFNYYTLELAKIIQNFNSSHPIIYSERQNDGNNYMSQIKELANESQLMSKGLLTQDLDLAMEETSPTIEAMGISMMMTLPPIGELVQYCQDPIDADDCTPIAKILIGDKSILNQGIGISLIDISNELLGKEQDNKLKNSLDSKYQKLICYTQSKNMQVALSVNKDIATAYIKDSIKYGDMEAAKRASFTVYNIEKQHGYNPDFNPNDCK